MLKVQTYIGTYLTHIHTYTASFSDLSTDAVGRAVMFITGLTMRISEDQVSNDYFIAWGGKKEERREDGNLSAYLVK